MGITLLQTKETPMKKIIILVLIGFSAFSQEHNIWYFGSKAGLDFSNGAPVAITNGQINTTEGCASIADAAGNLQFYTDGVTVYNKDHHAMENGTALTGHSSSTQSAIIIPKPGSATLYYIFTTTAEGYPDGLRYSTVDMEAADGLGAITEKNILLHTPTTEALTAMWHANGQDIWVVSHNYNSNLFAAYKITSQGVDATPVTSAFVPVTMGNGRCTMKASPDGHKLAFTVFNVQDNTHLFDFDTASGLVSNPVPLPVWAIYGLEFSPSGNVLYASHFRILYQFDLLAADIGASATEIFAMPLFEFAGSNIASLQRGPDNKIYVARAGHNTLSVINDPDTVGPGCGFQENAVTLGAEFENYNFLGLPNTVLSPVFKIDGTATSCIGTEITFGITASFSPLGNIVWDFGDGATATEHSPVHNYQAAGTYTVTLTSHNAGVARTTQSRIVVSPLPVITQPNAIELCDESGQNTAVFDLTVQAAILLGIQHPDDYSITYHTSSAHADLGINDLPQFFTNTSSPQVIYARLENKRSGCYASTFFDLIVRPKPVIAMPDSYGLCRGSNITLTAPEGFETYLWSTGETRRIINVAMPGSYILTVTKNTDGQLCESSKILTVFNSDAPTITQISTQDWTDSNNSISVTVSGNGSYEYSLDGQNYQDSPIFTGLPSGIYNVSVRDKYGCGSDMQEITVLMYPKFFTPNGDGINDIWRISYSWFEPGMTVHIMDRYGKRITSFKGNSTGWDGRYNGNELPATDYWFVVERKDGRQYRGHFAMIR